MAKKFHIGPTALLNNISKLQGTRLEVNMRTCFHTLQPSFCFSVWPTLCSFLSHPHATPTCVFYLFSWLSVYRRRRSLFTLCTTLALWTEAGSYTPDGERVECACMYTAYVYYTGIAQHVQYYIGTTRDQNSKICIYSQIILEEEQNIVENYLM